MKIKKLQIGKGKLDINLKFYFLLKQLVKAKLSEKQAFNFLEIYTLFKDSKTDLCNEKFLDLIQQIKGQDKQNILYTIIETLENEIDLDLFMFSLKLYLIKDLLLQEAKLTDVIGISDLEKLDPLSLKYDKVSVYRPYATRVNGALLALLFFSQIEAGKTNFMSDDTHRFIKKISEFAVKLKKNGVEPNQIFMLMFSESVNQSIISDSVVAKLLPKSTIADPRFEVCSIGIPMMFANLAKSKLACSVVKFVDVAICDIVFENSPICLVGTPN